MLYHTPVMVEECLQGLRIDPNGVYVDATFGGGGHSLRILEHLQQGKLVAFDQDEDAKKQAETIQSDRFTFCHTNFRYMKQYLKLNSIKKVDGILADLGVSSHQIDSADRGFSTRYDGPLDMRMDRKLPKSATQILTEYPEALLHKILGIYGEVKNAKTVANLIIQQRSVKKLERAQELIQLLQPIAPKGKEFKYYAQVFQALRIEVNQEIQALEDFLYQCGDVIDMGGRLVVMSYHSVEDRMVKNYINTGKMFGEVEKDFYGNKIRPFQAINRKPLQATSTEISKNNRARSAKLRIAERNKIVN